MRNRSAAFRRYVEEVAVLYRVAVSLTRHHADAEDLVQDTLLKAYRAADRFDGAYPRAWLLTILRNTHRNRLATTSRRSARSSGPPARGPSGAAR